MRSANGRQRLILPLAPAVAGLVGVVIAALVALMPARVLETLVVDSGIAAIIRAAEPPLGVTARAAIIIFGGGAAAAAIWFALYLLVGNRVVVLGSGDAGADGVPVLRRADAHPDAPPRRPLSADRELGTPFLEVRAAAGSAKGSGAPVHLSAEDMQPPAIDHAVDGLGRADGWPGQLWPKADQLLPSAQPATSALPAWPADHWPIVAPSASYAPPVPHLADPPREQPLPADLDQPLAAFDPGAIPVDPASWVPPPIMLDPVPPIASAPPLPIHAPSAPLMAGERLDSFPPHAAPARWAEPVWAPPPHAATPVGTPAQHPRRRATDRDSSADIHALLDRLERSMTSDVPASATSMPEVRAAPAAKGDPPRSAGLATALHDLRRKAATR